MIESGKRSREGARATSPAIQHQESEMTRQTRHDPYSAVHKGIRAAHMRCLVEIGASDASDNAGVERLIARIEDHLSMCNAHLHDENSVLHIALEARRPGASAHAAEDHDDHLQSFAEVRTLLERIAVATRDERVDLLAGLYRRFALFVAHDLEHMDHE